MTSDPTDDPARTGTGSLVLGIYQDLLGVAARADDDFFDLGGHSMLAVLAMGELSRSIGVDLPLRLIFDHPTGRELALAVDRHLAT